MKTVQDYLNLVTSEHQDKPNFTAMVAFTMTPSAYIQTLLTSMMENLFDLDKPPVGDQLDIIGQWVGVSRKVKIPITGVYFSWDGAEDIGWDFGVWEDPNQPAAITVLPDDAYLTLIRARIAANHWDGTTEGAYEIWAILFPALNILIQDNQNMSFILAVQGTVVDSLTKALLTQGYLPLKPEGVQITEYVFPVDTGPLFGWDTDSAFIDGWDSGSWGVEVPPT